MGWGSTERKLLIALAALLSSGLIGSTPWRNSIESEPVPALVVDANTVPSEVLGALPGLGPALSGRIIEAREVTPFRTLDDLDRRVKGIGPAKVSAIRPFLRFDPTSVPPR